MIRWFSTEKKFESCTDYNKKTGRKWCATKTTSNDRYVPGHWGECPDTYVCNTDEGRRKKYIYEGGGFFYISNLI